MRRMGLVGAWLLVVVVVTTVTWQIVSAADDQVSDRPTSLNVAAPAISRLTSTMPSPTTELTVTSTTVRQDTSTTSPGETTDGAGANGTTASEPDWQTYSVPTSGGTVVLRYRPEEVTYQAASPKKGFSLEVDNYGPPEVAVKFESEDSEIEVHASWRNDGLDVEISEPGHD